MLTSNDIEKARQGDLKILCDLDERGLSPATGENEEDFAKRLEALRCSLIDMERKLSTEGQATVDTLKLKSQDRIISSYYAAPQRQTSELYGFKCDWVPGFFTDPAFSWLFGGCTYSYPPDFFTVFIIGNKLRKKKKFLCYDRNEILAHELCHVARAGLNSTEFEEHFAYQTSSSAFRRAFGGIMHSQGDTLIFLCACAILIAAQVLLPIYAPTLPPGLGWLVFGAVILFLVLRHLHTTRIYNIALRKLNIDFFDRDNATARMLLFHATDQEIRRIAKAKSPRELLQELAQKELRWKIALERCNPKKS